MQALLPSLFILLKTVSGYKTSIVPAATQSFTNPRSPAQYNKTQASTLGRVIRSDADVLIVNLHVHLFTTLSRKNTRV